LAALIHTAIGSQVRVIEADDSPLEMPITMYEVDKTETELAVDTAMEAARLAAADAVEVGQLMGLIDHVIRDAEREARRSSMQNDRFITSKADGDSNMAALPPANPRLERLKQELKRKQEANMGWDVYYERPDRLNPLYIMGYKHMFRAPAVEVLHRIEINRIKEAARRAAEAAINAAAFAVAEYERMFAILREMLEAERRRQDAIRRAAAEAAAAAWQAANYARTAAENAMIACGSLDIVKQRIYEAAMIAAMAARDARLIANQSWQFMLDMKDRCVRWFILVVCCLLTTHPLLRFGTSVEMVKFEMKKNLRRKKKRLQAKKSFEQQLRQQHTFLEQAASEEERAIINEQLTSIVRLWEREQQIWWSEDQVSLSATTAEHQPPLTAILFVLPCYGFCSS
jgi:hypothetical protein